MLNELDHPNERIESKIFLIRGKKVIMDKDLAILYEVATRQLNQAVKRNISRFPEDFMFQLNKREIEAFKSEIGLLDDSNLKSQFVTSSYGGTRKPPFVFTELGIAMLSSVLKSERAIQVNIQIEAVFKLIKDLLDEGGEIKPRIGFDL